MTNDQAAETGHVQVVAVTDEEGVVGRVFSTSAVAAAGSGAAGERR